VKRKRAKMPQTRNQFIEAIALAKATGGDWERLSRIYLEKFPPIWTASPEDMDVPLDELGGGK
jgi:hypothetical protein